MPVVWFNPPATAVDHEVDDELVVVGRVVRRFFHAGGSLQSRTEVVADVVVPRRETRRARQALARAARDLAASS